MRKLLALVWLVVLAGLGPAPVPPAGAQGFGFEHTESFDVDILIEPSGSLLVTETIVQSFGNTPRHGIFRFIPNRLRYDDAFDRIYPIELVSVRASQGTPDDVEIGEQEGGFTIRIGDPDVVITGEHAYEIVYRVRGAMNGFADHDELFWNAIGDRWEQPITRFTVRVRGPAGITRVACLAGPVGSTLPCGRARVRGGVAQFGHDDLPAYEALSVVVALPPGSVESTEPILEERWSLDRAFERTPLTVGGAFGLLVAVVAGFSVLVWRRGRDIRYRGSQVDQTMGGDEGQTQAVPLFEKQVGVVEFGPPQGLRPGQIGTLIDERANTLDVTATIVDLAVRGYLVIEEIPKKWFLGKPDWKLRRLQPESPDLLSYEKRLLEGLFADGDEVELSDLRKTFSERLQKVQEALYEDVVARRWFLRRPDRVRQTWTAIGWGVLAAGVTVTVALARWTHLGILGLPLVIGGLLLVVGGARRMPARTAKGTAMTRRVNGFRVVIEKAEEHVSRWAEQENVFTRLLPYAVVFGVTEKWARAFESLGERPREDLSWYVSSRPFVYHEFADSIDSFTVTTSGTIASTPSGSGGSGFGGGGGAGGGGGGGGGGSW